MRNLRDALLWRGTKPDAESEADKLRAAARRMGYDVVVRPTLRRYGKQVYREAPYGILLTPLDG